MSAEAAGAAAIPPIIQGGMGVGVSGWLLARAVSLEGHLGVVSGTAQDVLLARQLQLGDIGGHLRRALAAFPFPEIVARVMQRYFIADGKAGDAPFRPLSMINHQPSRATQELVVVSNFAAVQLAKEGHSGAIGLNLLEKIQPPTLLALYGAMLAGVNVVLMGAGIPRQIPGALDRLAAGQAAELRMDVTGGTEPVYLRFDPAAFTEPAHAPMLRRPAFLAVVASPVLADNLRRKASGKVDGFVVEAPTAGGHNAPPRGPMQIDASGAPIYGPRDAIDLEKFRALGLPFWLAGGYGRGGKLRDAQAAGASGIQVGTAFAFCRESGVDPHLKAKVLRSVRDGTFQVQTSAVASPTGFPFKVTHVEGSISEPKVYENRTRVCDIGLLREAYRRPDGKVGYRCPAEPVEAFLAKGGDLAQTEGRMCLCNSLVASAGVGQLRTGGYVEPPLITSGDDVETIRMLLTPTQDGFTAAQVIRHLLS